MGAEKVSQPAIADKTRPGVSMTYDEFIDWLDEDTHAEWVDGEVEFLSPVNLQHQKIAGFLAALLQLFAEANGCGTVLSAPFQMRLQVVKRGREPDILFVSRENSARLTETYLDGPADLVIEIVSPQSMIRDRGDKYAEYEMEGVREYWVIDPEAKRADFFTLGADGRYDRVRPNENGIYRSRVLNGFVLDENWLWQQPLPKVSDIVKAWSPDGEAPGPK